MSRCDIQVVLEKSDLTYGPGETIRGEVRTRTSEDVTTRGLTVKVGWRTHGRGNQREGPAAAAKLFEGTWRAGDEGTYPFELIAPAGPATYHGTLLNVDYYVTATADVAWSLDPKGEVEILLPPADVPEYSFGSELKPPADAMAVGEMASIGASVVLLGCFALPGLLVLAFGGVLLLTTLRGGGVGSLAGGLFTCAFGAVFALLGTGGAFAMHKRRLAQQRLGKPRIVVSPSSAQPGEEVSVLVEIEPRTALTIGGGTICLVGRERVVSGSGTNRTTHTHELYKLESRPAIENRHLRAGEHVSLQETLMVPIDASPTFVADDNELTWNVITTIKIDGWPDWEQQYPLTVRPHPQ